MLLTDSCILRIRNWTIMMSWKKRSIDGFSRRQTSYHPVVKKYFYCIWMERNKGTGVMFHFTRRRIEAHVCICFVALKVYKELERLLKLSNINMSVDKVLALAQTIVTIQVTLPQSKQTITRTMLMKRHQRIAPLFNDGFWGTH